MENRVVKRQSKQSVYSIATVTWKGPLCVLRVRVIVFRNETCQNFCYKSLLIWFLDHFNTTFIGIFYFKQILKCRKTLNAKTSDKNLILFRNTCSQSSMTLITLITPHITHTEILFVFTSRFSLFGKYNFSNVIPRVFLS